MKGISAIIATVLILLITVALAAAGYMFFSTTFSSITQTSGQSISSTTSKFQASFQIESVFNSTANVINFTIRNTGSTTLNASKIAVYINDANKAVTSPSPLPTIAPDQVVTFGLSDNKLNYCNGILKVTFAEVASPQTYVIKC
jgi:flagellin-like protein